MKYRATVRSVDPLSTTVPSVQNLGTVPEPQQCTNFYVCVFHVKDPFASLFLNTSPVPLFNYSVPYEHLSTNKHHKEANSKFYTWPTTFNSC